MFRQLNRAAIW